MSRRRQEPATEGGLRLAPPVSDAAADRAARPPGLLPETMGDTSLGLYRRVLVLCVTYPAVINRPSITPPGPARWCHHQGAPTSYSERLLEVRGSSLVDV